jgi:hypothetical protein
MSTAGTQIPIQTLPIFTPDRNKSDSLNNIKMFRVIWQLIDNFNTRNKPLIPRFLPNFRQHQIPRRQPY